MVYSDLSPVMKIDIRSTENPLCLSTRGNLSLHSYHVTAEIEYPISPANASTFFNLFLWDFSFILRHFLGLNLLSQSIVETPQALRNI